MEAIYNVVDFKILNDGDNYNINGIDYTFFDIQAKGTKQFGFKCLLNNKKCAFLGDETLNSNLYDRFRGYDYVLHEAFCLDTEDSYKEERKGLYTNESEKYFKGKVIVPNDLEVINVD